MLTAELPADLSASHDLLHALLAVSLPGIILARPVYAADEPTTIIDLACVQLNPAAQQMLHQPARPPETLLTLFPHLLATGAFAFYRDTFLSGQPGEYAVNYPYDGVDNFFMLSARRCGELLVIGFSNTAVQERSQVEQALRESQAQEQAARAVAEQQRHRFLEVLTQVPAYIAVYQGPDHIYQFVNPFYQSLFPHRSFLGRPFREGTPEAEALGVVALFDQVYQTGEPVYLREMEGWFDFHGNGQPVQVFLNISLHPLRNVQGQIDGVLDFTYDVSEQVRARRQVEQLNQELEARVQERTAELQVARTEAEAQRARLERVFQHAPAAIAVYDGPEFVFELVNPVYQALLPGRTLLGKSMRQAFPEAAELPIYQALHRVYETGRSHEELDQLIPVAGPDGQLQNRYFNFTLQARYDAHGHTNGVIGFGFETTEQVAAREQVQVLNDELAAINRELTDSNTQLTRTNVDLDTFVYTASHDLKAPITNIEGILLALRARLPAEVQQEEMVAKLLDMLQGTVTRFQLTITQLTDIAKLQLAHTGPAEPVPLAQVVEAVRQDLVPQLDQAGTHLTMEVAPELVVSFSPANLRSIVYNLLSNAIKYRAFDRPSQVLMRAEQTPQAIVLTVQDNGLGMTEVQQRHLFRLFQRLHTHVEGTGVGLYIVKRLAENGGGTITVQSQPEVGSTFTVTFPNPRA